MEFCYKFKNDNHLFVIGHLYVHMNVLFDKPHWSLKSTVLIFEDNSENVKTNPVYGNFCTHKFGIYLL